MAAATPRDVKARIVPSPVVWWLVVLVVGSASVSFAALRSCAVPAPRDAASTPVTEFSAERASAHVKVLAHDIGHRIVGSPNNEVRAPQYVVWVVGDVSSSCLCEDCNSCTSWWGNK